MFVFAYDNVFRWVNLDNQWNSWWWYSDDEQLFFKIVFSINCNDNPDGLNPEVDIVVIERTYVDFPGMA